MSRKAAIPCPPGLVRPPPPPAPPPKQFWNLFRVNLTSRPAENLIPPLADVGGSASGKVMSRPLTVIYTAGVFDLLHRGHLNLLWRSRQLADLLVVGVVSDGGCRAYKGHFPEENEQLRIRNVRDCGLAHVVVSQRGTDPSANLRRFRPDKMTHGDDWSKLLEGNGTLIELGCELVLLPYTPGISSTMLREVAH